MSQPRLVCELSADAATAVVAGDLFVFLAAVNDPSADERISVLCRLDPGADGAGDMDGATVLLEPAASCSLAPATPSLVDCVPTVTGWCVPSTNWLEFCRRVCAAAGCATIPTAAGEALARAAASTVQFLLASGTAVAELATCTDGKSCTVQYVPSDIGRQLCASLSDATSWTHPLEFGGPVDFIRITFALRDPIDVPVHVLRTTLWPLLRAIIAQPDLREWHECDPFVRLLVAELFRHPSSAQPRGDVRDAYGVYILSTCLGFKHLIREGASFANALATEFAAAEAAAALRYTPGALTLALCILYSLLPGCNPWDARTAARTLALRPALYRLASTWPTASAYALDMAYAFFVSPQQLPADIDELVLYGLSVSCAAVAAVLAAHTPRGATPMPSVLYDVTGAAVHCTFYRIPGHLDAADAICMAGSDTWMNRGVTQWDTADFLRANESRRGGDRDNDDDVVGIDMTPEFTPSFIRSMDVIFGSAERTNLCTILLASAERRGVDRILVRKDDLHAMQVCLCIVTGTGSATMPVWHETSIVDAIVAAFVSPTTLGAYTAWAGLLQHAFLTRLFYAIYGATGWSHVQSSYLRPSERALVFKIAVFCVTTDRLPVHLELATCIGGLLLLRANGVAQAVCLPASAIRNLTERLMQISVDPVGHVIAGLVGDGVDGSTAVTIPHSLAMQALDVLVPAVGEVARIAPCLVYDSIAAVAQALIESDCGVEFGVDCVLVRSTVQSEMRTPHNTAQTAIRALWRYTRRDVTDKNADEFTVSGELEAASELLVGLSKPALAKQNMRAPLVLLGLEAFVPRIPCLWAQTARLPYLAGVAFASFVTWHAVPDRVLDACNRTLDPAHMSRVASTLSHYMSIGLADVVASYKRRLAQLSGGNASHPAAE